MELKILQKVKKNRILVKSKPKFARKKIVSTANHHYGTETCEKPDMDARDFDKHQENVTNMTHIERETVDLSNSEKWMELRSKLLTASNFGKVCAEQNQPVTKHM